MSNLSPARTRAQVPRKGTYVTINLPLSNEIAAYYAMTQALTYPDEVGCNPPSRWQNTGWLGCAAAAYPETVMAC